MADPIQAHPLFPLEEDSDEDAAPPDVHWIAVCRWETGNKVTAPRLFRANELTTLEQIADEYGGGKYELLGRGADNSRIIAKRSYSLPGPSKPMFADAAPKSETAAPDMAKLLQILQSAQQPAQSGFNMQSVLALLGVLAPVFQAYLQNQAAQQAAAVAQQQNMFGTIITASQANADKLVAVMGQLYTAKPPVSAGGTGDDFRRGMEYMQEFIQGQMDAKTDSGDEPSLQDIIGLAKAYMESQGRAPAVAVAGNGAAT